MSRYEKFQLVSEHLSFLMAVQQLGLPNPVGFEDVRGLLDTVQHGAVQRNQRRIQEYQHRTELMEALRGVVGECRQGNCSRADILRDLADAPHLGIDLAELGCTYEEVCEWHRGGWVQRMRASLDVCRQGQYQGIDPLVAEIEAIMMVQPWQPPISLEELGTNEEELERFRRVKSLLL